MKDKRLILITVFIIPILISACMFSVIRGSGVMTSETRQVNDFERVDLSGVGTIYITQGNEETLTIEAENNILTEIESTVRNGTLTIGFGDQNWPDIVQPTEPIKYYLTLKELTGLNISGAGRVEIDDLDTTQLDINSSGAGDIEINELIAKDLNVVLSGAGSCKIIGGEVTDQNITISGAGNHKASDLQSQVTNVSVSGMGSVEVWVLDALDVGISGAGNVEYYGSPSVSQDISGAGRVESLGDN